MDTAIRLIDVTKRFPGTSRAAVDGFSLDVAAGGITVLVGPSGCGKTTVLRMINRLEEPTSGSILLEGDDVRSQPVHQLRRRIGYVIQQTGLFPHRTVADNIATVPGLLGWSKQRITARVAELAELVGLAPDLLDRYPAALSGGQQQRVGVARALAADPPVLLMDEPYSAVDPIVRQHLQDELLALQHQVGKTIVLVTHDVDEAVRLADRLAVVNTGGLLEQYDTPANVLRSPASPFVEQFLGAERGLRRMALLTVADVPLGTAPVVTPVTTPADARLAMDGARTNWVAVVDGLQLLGWVDANDLNGQAAVAQAPMRGFGPAVQPATALREALEVVVTSPIRAVAVTDDDNRFLGLLTIDNIGQGLQA
jgi:osmoprotectant transport system ATP-binding protein